MKRPRWKRLALWLPAGAWYAVICFFSSQTGDESGEVSKKVLTDALKFDIYSISWSLYQFLTFLIRKGAHMGIFFILTALLLLPIRTPGSCPKLPHLGFKWQALAALGLCALLAGLDEFHQTFVPGRSGMLRDVGIDLLGGALFLLLYALWRFLRKKIFPPSGG